MATYAAHRQEVTSGERFEFGANWARFLETLSEKRIADAEASLKAMLECESLEGRRFLDIGSGSGLFSLVARRLGAQVFSFDYDPDSVRCTQELRRRYFPDDRDWRVEAGSVLDREYLKRLGTFDIVYSWGVLHHTGAMWDALANVAPLVAENGKLYIALYNNQGNASRRWTAVKRFYNRSSRPVRKLLEAGVFVHLWWKPIVRDFVLLRPFRSLRTYQGERGMHLWHDLVDWVGGYPFEVAKPEEVFGFFKARGFTLAGLATCAGSLGCNEFVFQKR